MPFLGIPSMGKRSIYITLGLILILVGYQLRRNAYLRSIEDHTGERKTDVYVEQVEQLFVEPSAQASTPSEEHHEEEMRKIKTRRARTKKYEV
jgi:hypothetical protein